MLCTKIYWIFVQLISFFEYLGKYVFKINNKFINFKKEYNVLIFRIYRQHIIKRFSRCYIPNGPNPITLFLEHKVTEFVNEPN